MFERNMYNYECTCIPETEKCPSDLEINKLAVDLQQDSRIEH